MYTATVVFVIVTTIVHSVSVIKYTDHWMNKAYYGAIVAVFVSGIMFDSIPSPFMTLGLFIAFKVCTSLVIGIVYAVKYSSDK